MNEYFRHAIETNVSHALEEDIRDGDITAQLIPQESIATGRVITRELAVICGVDWVNEVFARIDARIELTWKAKDGDLLQPDDTIFQFSGPARGLLTGERTALNFLQMLSATATQSRHYAEKVKHTSCQVLDTRKTLPGLRIAQKYAVHCGGANNHRIGLYDAFLIKENHIMACGSIANAVQQAKSNAPGKPVEVEVETMQELEQAFDAAADIVMLDNFSLDQMRAAVANKPQNVKLEASGNVTETTLVAIAETGVDFVSIGALTKDCKAIDLSMRFD
ncbi:MAG: nicotinate-nucleotide diphosphorylase (carboxylating) [Gammaproteobacteria bacterium]|nr:MAG: nicotinate-nucleotide diphosphorylase (carboxylating) [Gammaproteobacteria bacterium]